ncbi:glycosyltransferase [Geodermatophilus sp. SYSU D01106]
MPRLLVMMPARAASDTISLAAASTLRAMPRDAQLMIWVDGDTETLTAADKLAKDKRVLVHHSPISVGGGASRREMMRVTDSEFVASMDADDVAFPWRFSLQMRHLRKYDASFTAVVRFKGRTIPTLSLPVRYLPKDLATALLIHNPLSHPTFTARRQAVERAGGYRDLRVAQDWDLWLRMAASGAHIYRSPLPTVAYRSSPGQVSQATTYTQQVQSNAMLRESLASLFASTARVPSGAHSTEGDTLKAAVATMPRLLRHYYFHVISHNGTTIDWFEGDATSESTCPR